MSDHPLDPATARFLAVAEDFLASSEALQAQAAVERIPALEAVQAAALACLEALQDRQPQTVLETNVDELAVETYAAFFRGIWWYKTQWYAMARQILVYHQHLTRALPTLEDPDKRLGAYAGLQRFETMLTEILGKAEADAILVRGETRGWMVEEDETDEEDEGA